MKNINGKTIKVLVCIVAAIVTIICGLMIIAIAQEIESPNPNTDETEIVMTTQVTTVTTKETTTSTTTSTTSSTTSTTEAVITTVTTTTTTVVVTEPPVVENVEQKEEIVEVTVEEPPVQEVVEEQSQEEQPVQQDSNIIGLSGSVTINGYTFEFDYATQLYEFCNQYGLNPKIMYGIFMAESTCRQYSNLCGITQPAITSFERATGIKYSNYKGDPIANMHVACYCLRGAYDHYGNGSDYDALAGYNQGYWGHKIGASSSYATRVINYASTVY